MSIELRYCEKMDQYYIQVRSEDYKNIQKKMNRLSKTISALSKQDRKEELKRLRAKYQLLMRERQEVQRYVRVAREDIPTGLTARPMKDIRGALDTVTPQQYQKLLESLRKGGKTLEADASASEPVDPAVDAAGGAGAAGQRAG